MKKRQYRYFVHSFAIISIFFLISSITPLFNYETVNAAREPQNLQSANELLPVPEKLRPEIHVAKRLAAVPREKELELTLALDLPDRKTLQTFIDQLHNEQSPLYHQWLTPQQFGQRFGMPKEEYQAMVDWLKEQGFNVTHTWPNRLAIDFKGSVAQIETIFHTELSNYKYQGRNYYAHSRLPQMPARFATKVVKILGLENFSEPEPLLAQRLGGAATSNINQNVTANGNTAIGPKDIQTAYNSAPLIAIGNDGSGVTIAVAARCDFELSDVRKFRNTFDLPAKDPVKNFPLGTVNNLDGVEEMEVLLDVELSGAVAPGATIMPIIAPSITKSLQSIYNNFPEIPIVSLSFGQCEQRLTTDTTKVFDAMYMQGVAQGQTTFVAAGDDGVNDCRDGRPAVNGLASSPNVVAVGGTRLDAKFDNNGRSTGYGSEQVWNAGRATGGGVSTIFDKPIYQVGPGVPNDGKRDLPDVAFIADPSGPGLFIVKDDAIFPIGGTSAAAPAWAGILALVEQFHKTGALGNINFRLYALGAGQQNGGIKVYNDITLGNNSLAGVTGYSAQTGYDLVSGWGSVNIDAFTRNFFVQQNNLQPVKNLTGQPDTTATAAVKLQWQAPDMANALVAEPQEFRNSISLDELKERSQFQLPTFTENGLELRDYHIDTIPNSLNASNSSDGLEPQASMGQPPMITGLDVNLKGKNKAVANFTVTDPDNNLGKISGVSIVLFDRTLQPVAAVLNGNILKFGDKKIFTKPLDFTGKPSGSFPFTLKGVKQVPSASIWMSGLRDDVGNVNLAPLTVPITGRITDAGSKPQISNVFSAIFNNDDSVGINLDGTDLDGDTVGLSLSFLDADGIVVFALGLIGDQGFKNFSPIPIEKVNPSVNGQVNFSLSFAISGITAQVKSGTLKSVGIALVDSAGNRTDVKVVPFSSAPPLSGLKRYNVYRSTISPVKLFPGNLVGTVSSDTTTFTDRSLPIADGQTAYYYVVTAVYGDGESPTSNEVMVIPKK